MAGQRIATVVWTDPSATSLPPGVVEVERLDPLLITVVSGSDTAVDALAGVDGVVAVVGMPTEGLDIVRGIARVTASLDELTARACNGYPGRLPGDAATTGACPAYPVMSSDRRYLVDTDDQIRRIGPMCRPTVVNLSLEPPDWLAPSLARTDPLAVAVRHAATLTTVVVAAGSGGERGTDDTRWALARLPDTLAIGATADAAGTRLAEGSSRGAPGGLGPFACAWEESIAEHPRRGTSFAAPRVTREIEVLAGFLSTAAQATVADERDTVPLCGVGIVDEGPLGGIGSRLPISAYPIGAGVDVEVVRAALARKGAPVELDGATVRRALAASARHMPGYGPHQVGHGFVSEETTLDYLRRMDGRELRRVFTGRDSGDPGGGRVASEDLERASHVWARGALWVYWDYRGGTGAVA